jgi:Na+/H+ antiporter NhaD/arsenite permease-like protein
MKKRFIPVSIFRFYLEGFKSMDLGKTLWLIILVKLFIMFVVLKLFFFPNYLNQFNTKQEKENHIANELVKRSLNHLN